MKYINLFCLLLMGMGSIQPIESNIIQNLEKEPMQLIKQNNESREEVQEELTVGERIKESFVQGLEASIKLAIPTVVVTSIVMLMLYQPYQSLHQSITESTKSFNGMKESFAHISQSFDNIKGSMEGSKAAFQHIDSTFKEFVEMTKSSWAGYLFGGKK